MREILYKSLTSLERRKKDFWVCESIENEKVIARTQRRCIYKIKEEGKLKDIGDIDKWILEHNCNNPPSYLKRFTIFKKSDSRTGEELFMCKVVGNLFAVTKESAFSIVFMHIIKITLMNLSSTKYKQKIPD